MMFPSALFLGLAVSIVALPTPYPLPQQGDGFCWIVPADDDPNAVSTQVPCDKPEPRPYSSMIPSSSDSSIPDITFDPIPSPTWVPAIAPTPTSPVDDYLTPYTSSSTYESEAQTGALGGIGGPEFPTPYPTLPTTGSGWGGIGGNMNPWTAAATSYTYSSIMPPWGSSSSDYGYISSTSYLNNGAGWGRPTDSTTYTRTWGQPSLTSTYNNGAGWGPPPPDPVTSSWGGYSPTSTYNNGAGWGRPTDSFTRTWGQPSPTSTYNNGAGWGPPPPEPVASSWGGYNPTPVPTWAGGQSGWDNQPAVGGLGGNYAPTSTCRRNWLGRCT
jgi:hypothetical protein